MSISIHVSATGTPSPFNTHVDCVDRLRLVGVNRAMLASLEKLVAEGEAGAEGRPSVVAAGADRKGSVRLNMVATENGEKFAFANFGWDGLAPEHAAFIGECISGIDDAATKG